MSCDILRFAPGRIPSKDAARGAPNLTFGGCMSKVKIQEEVNIAEYAVMIGCSFEQAYKLACCGYYSKMLETINAINNAKHRDVQL